MHTRHFRTALLILSLTALGAPLHADEDDTKPAPVNASVAVTTVAPKQHVFHARVEAFGTLTGDSRRTQTLTLAQAGQVAAIAVAAGERVRQGQTLLDLTTDPATRSAFLQAQTALDLARGELARSEQLATQHLATNAQVATARKALADAQANLDAQRRLGGGSAESALAAPADGVVTAVLVARGERVPAGAKLIELTPRHALAAQLGVEPEQAAAIRPGMTVAIRPVYGRTAPLAGTVALVADAIDPQTHLVGVLADLKPGAHAAPATGTALSAEIDTATYTAWAVPRGAVLSDEHGSYLYQIENGKAHRVAVEVRSPAGDTLGVAGALDAQAPVVVLGAYELSEGAAVRVAGNGP